MRLRNTNDLIKIGDAIKILCRKTCHPGAACPDIYCTEMWDEFENVERVDAVQQAVKDVPSARPEPCKDAVSRSRVKLLLERLRDEVDDGYGFDYQSAVDDLRDMPSAQPERIRARWEKQVLGWKCSNCTACTNDFGAREFNFCPACGADMRGEQNG